MLVERAGLPAGAGLVEGALGRLGERRARLVEGALRRLGEGVLRGLGERRGGGSDGRDGSVSSGVCWAASSRADSAAGSGGAGVSLAQAGGTGQERFSSVFSSTFSGSGKDASA
ncbi:hypothetical protein ACFSTC_56985 [Nonomuraea ferruginea]